MLYSILVYETAEQLADRVHPERAPAYWGAYHAYNEALKAAGVAAGGAGLEPSPTAATVRLADGKRHVQDGPCAATKEQLGGVFFVEVPNLDAALEWAARCPSASTGGAAEVRAHLVLRS